MLQKVRIDGGYRRWSDRNVLIRRVQTGQLFEIAVDIADSTYSYEETDIPIKPKEVTANDH